MTIKRVKEYDMFATGDACIFSMAGEPEYMYKFLTPSKHYVGYIKNVDNMRHEYAIVITGDDGKPYTITHYADPIREPVGMPLYFMMEVLLDKETYMNRLHSRKKKNDKYQLKRYEDEIKRNMTQYEKGMTLWDTLKER